MDKVGNNKRSGWIVVLIALLAFAVQWGMVNEKLTHVETRLDELITEARSLRTEYRSVERRVAYLEGLVGLGLKP